jgi:RND family efflux transporter MFP subunit
MIQEAEAEVQAATAEVELRQAEIAQYTATRVFREKEFRRFTELAERRSVDQRVADERQKDYEAAQAMERVAQAAVQAAKGRQAKAIAATTKAKADLVAAQANVRAATAALGRARILVEYTKLVSPYDGVITLRSLHRGDFVRSAAEGETNPILAVARTDLMRIVVYVPDRDTPAVHIGAEATLRVDALSGETFRGKVARFANAEDPLNRTMRTEIDLPNPTGRLHEGMYGTVTILLEPPSPDVLTIPSSALIEAAQQGQGTVYVVQGGKAHRRTVELGKDDGLHVEVRSGLMPDDEVVVAYTGSMEDGEEVVATSAPASTR